jgi:hypothetical protein
MGLVPPRVQAFIGIMPGLSTIVANAGRKFFRLESLLMWPLAAVVTGNSPLTQVHFRECLLVAPAFPSFFVRSIGSFDGGSRESETLS